MAQVVIENPVLNSPYREPTRHFRFTQDGITDEIVEARRISAYFVPIPSPRKREARQLQFETEWTRERIKENDLINRIRARVALWRKGGYLGTTHPTARLLSYWQSPERERLLFFCQIEALETAIYIAEVAHKYNDAWIENELQQANDGANPGLFRLAFKMATGSGKTVVMGMLIAWQTLNKVANPQDGRFSDSFLIVTPGITIRDRLRVLLPSDPENYYRQRDIVPSEVMETLGQAKIVIVNRHTFKLREHTPGGKLTKAILSDGSGGSAFTETPDQMVRRVCRDLGTKRGVVVINDEAHHCYRRKPETEEERLSNEERQEVNKRNEEARMWLSGLEAVKAKIGVKAVYDLSATPFFLKGSGYGEGTLFPWVISDFSLIDAIESGIVKVPRVPVADDTLHGDQPTYRNLWDRIRDTLPKKGRKADQIGEGEPQLPVELQGALHSLYSNYEKHFHRWEESSAEFTPPVFIVVCSNTAVSKLMYDYIAGWEKRLSDGRTRIVPGSLALFSNVRAEQWRARPYTILIDSEQLESGEGMSTEFKKDAAREIEKFKTDYRARFPGRSADDLTDEDLLREVMNTVGKRGKLGEDVRCVVSVSMLTEGWDANTVTHILGIRAFGTQLLCEQVVGRALRRVSYVSDNEGMFAPEYAEVYGVPFSFIPAAGSQQDPKPSPPPVRVRALPERHELEITFPRVIGYRYDIPGEHLPKKFTPESYLVLTTKNIPTRTENAPIVGEASIHTLDDLKRRRPQEVAFLLAKLVLEKYFRQDGEKRTDRRKPHQFDAEVKAWLFPQVLDIARQWLDSYVKCKDGTFPQMLLLIENAHDAADKIFHSIADGITGEQVLKPILRPYDPYGSTALADFDTIRPTYRTKADKSHLSHVVTDSGWEAHVANALEAMNEVICYAKNQGIGFTIPYTINGEERSYLPDFLVRLNDGHGLEDPLNMIIEVSGERRRDKAAKVATMRTLWIPAVNNHGSFGRWAFLEITDPNTVIGAIRIALSDDGLLHMETT